MMQPPRPTLANSYSDDDAADLAAVLTSQTPGYVPPGDHDNNAPAPEMARVPPAQANPSGRVLPGRKPNSNAANTAVVPPMLLGQQPDDDVPEVPLVSMLVNGYAVDDLAAEVGQERGPMRYLRADGVGDCMAYGVQGNRLQDGLPVSLLAHLSSHDYTPGAKPGPTYDRLAQLKEQLRDTHSIAATNDHHKYDPGRRPAVGDAPLHDTASDEPGYNDYLFDTEAFGLHLAGKKVGEDTAVGKSVTEYPTTQQTAQRMQRAQAPAGRGGGGGGGGRGGGNGPQRPAQRRRGRGGVLANACTIL